MARQGHIVCTAHGITIGILALLFLTVPLGTVAQEEFSEYDVKAAFLVNFLKYVEWPEDAFEDGDTPYTIGILGKNPFGDTLEQLVEDQELNGRRIAVKTADDVEQLKTCHLLFFSGKDRITISRELDTLKDLPVLTVGEKPGFAEGGGVINFTIVRTKVKFEISLKAAKRNKLKISSQLLKVAIKVIE